MSRLCYVPFATFTFWSDGHVSALLLSHPSKGCELICMTQHLSHTNKHRTNWLFCPTYQLPHQSKQPPRFLFVYSRTTRCVSSTEKNMVYYYGVIIGENNVSEIILNISVLAFFTQRGQVKSTSICHSRTIFLRVNIITSPTKNFDFYPRLEKNQFKKNEKSSS